MLHAEHDLVWHADARPADDEFDIAPCDPEARIEARRLQRAADRAARREAEQAAGITPAPRTRKNLPQILADELRPAAFYVPPGLDLAAIGIDPCDLDRARYIMNLIRWRYLHWWADAEGYARLKWDYLARVVGAARLPHILRRLRDGGAIEYAFRGAGRARGYRILDPHRRARWVRVVCADDAFSARIQAVYGQDAVGPLTVHGWLGSKLPALDIDLERAEAIIAALPVPGRESGPDDFHPRTDDEHRLILSEHARTIADRQVAWSVCPYGRFHSPLTRLARALRCCLSVAGERLLELDVANSQPLFLGLVGREFYRDRKARQRLLAREFGGGVYRYDRRTATNCGPCPNAGVETFVGVCEQGAFYETMMRPGDDRDTFKPELFRQVFFGSNRSAEPRPLLARFRRKYPAVADVLRELKWKDYRQSAWTLQNAEATLCIGRICGRLMAERPDLAVFTIHDSWLVRPGDAGYVRSVVEAEFRAAGAAVTVRVKTPEGK